jgi:cytidine deaminase
MRQQLAGITEAQLARLVTAAWEVRENAYIFGNTKVGAASMSRGGGVFVGCNIEHKFRSHDVHAEVNAITSMVAAGQTDLVAVVVVAERHRFTPCGACMDWIYQFGGDSCIVAYQSEKGGELRAFRAQELMPYYPIGERADSDQDRDPFCR